MSDKPSLWSRIRQADMSWASESKDASFERWVAQNGTQFLPTNTSGWPVAEFSPGLLSAIELHDIGPSSYSAIYRSQPSVYTVVEFLAWQLAGLSLKVYRRNDDDDREHLQDHELTRILSDPAPGLTYNRFMHRTVADLCIFGNCYWAKMFPPASVSSPRERVLTPLPAALVTPRGGTLVQADFYDVGIGSTRKTFSAEEIVHFRRYSPDDLRVGVSPLEPLRRVLSGDASAMSAWDVFWRKSARIDGIIERPKDAPWDQTARNRFREGWRKFARGGSTEGEAGILEDGMVWKAAAFSPKEAEFIEGRKLTLETVARAFNIPVSVLGLTETATYASQQAFHKALYQDTLGPWTRMLEDEIQAGLIPWITDDPDIYVEFNIEEKLRGSFEEQADMLLKAVGGPYMTRAEARARLNLPKIDDPEADELVITNNMVAPEAEQQPAPVVQLAPGTEAQEATS